jgi:alanine racemase
LWHLLNSEGVQHHPEAQFDMVRLGIGLYGISNNPAHAKHLRPVSTLVTHISQLKQLAPGESVGYNRGFMATAPTQIATLPIGYADGYRRSLGNGVGQVWINGHMAPVVGNVCMDMMMIDVTQIPCAEGDAVEIFGPHVPITQLATWAGTISYEMLTGISQRVKRVYFQE